MQGSDGFEPKMSRKDQYFIFKMNGLAGQFRLFESELCVHLRGMSVVAASNVDKLRRGFNTESVRKFIIN